MATESIQQMLNNLSQTGVRIMANVNAPEEVKEYTPKQPVNIAYCGTRNSAEETLQLNQTVINTEKVTFQRGQSKIAAIQDSIVNRAGGLPGFQGEGTLLLYKKTSSRCEKIKNLDKDLKDMVKHKARTNGQLTICVFVLNQERQNGPDEVQNNGQDATGQENVVVEIQNNGQDAPRQENVGNVTQEDLDEDDDLIHRMDNARSSPLQEVDAMSSQENSISSLDSQLNYAEIYPAGFTGWQGPDSLPDIPGVVQWRNISTMPEGDTIDLSDVAEPDRSLLPRLVKEIQKKSYVKSEETMDTSEGDEGGTLIHPSEWSEKELLLKCLTLDDDFSVFANERKLSIELLTYLVLISATETQYRVHVITPEDVDNISNNLNPLKPADDVEKILVLKVDENLAFSALVNNVADSFDDTNDYFLETIVAFENSKHYLSTLITKDVCRKINILYVNDNLTVYKNFLGFNFGVEEELPFLSFLFLSAREQLGLSTHYSMDHLRAIVEDVHERAKKIKKKTSEPPPVNSNSEVDLLAII